MECFARLYCGRFTKKVFYKVLWRLPVSLIVIGGLLYRENNFIGGTSVLCLK